MTVLAPAQKPHRVLSAGNKTHNINIILAPALIHSLAQLQRLVSTTTLFLLLRTYFLSILLLQNSLYATQVLLIQAVYAGKFGARTGMDLASFGWKKAEPLRKKLFFEFMVFVLGAGGNSVILLVFWPGWLVIGAGMVAASWAMG
ncbi:hypothetical protein BP6252_08434 [Coleophoma cylindrospora]|uniref:Uncharacterized protein n=1 Tax=Coleophoma cylindrospora TaxID=1849047 RepID=A0A3D8R6H1_9HELO|nr:hypothetical protein BP6252_08434 [Coleophoma cylindrospora]